MIPYYSDSSVTLYHGDALEGRAARTHRRTPGGGVVISLFARFTLAVYGWWLRRYWLADKITKEEQA